MKENVVVGVLRWIGWLSTAILAAAVIAMIATSVT
jgi:hypothetical protein